MKWWTSEWNWWTVRSKRLMYVVLIFLVIFHFFFLKNFYMETLLIWKKLLAIPLTPETADESINYTRNSPYITKWRNFTQREIASLSVLGRRLFLDEDVGREQKRKFIILAWKQTEVDEEKFIREFGEEKLDPFRFCSVKNCKLVIEDHYAHKADAIIFQMHRTKSASTYPRRTNFRQRWIWLTTEGPYHTLNFAQDKDISHYNGIFNWSMSYRMNSDVPVPYGRTVKMSGEEASNYEKVDYFNIKAKLAAAMMSNCNGENNRTAYVKQLQKYIEIDVYGPCFQIKQCHGHHNRDCVLLHEYKFFLAFENSNCKEYITEKVWWQSFQKGAIPVVMGPKIEDYWKFLPPNSFIHVDEFQSPYYLAKYLMFLEYNKAEFMKYHAWRSHYKVLNEHGFHGAHSYQYCRVCEALNYNDPAPKVYYHMERTVNKDTQCYPAKKKFG
ncbi:3-galactosyl-N-acetylglucosaminide 4-alpha-L-fucosyltransferase FUT3-like isoform X2 [Macrobrachium nipponense]|uniref:3-galactosyl-N-acetylglucosaminide 4-alpha-L-fucosyltransferase FUT3-like isoform X2 n=1 Tax=Macrobrachium nipponense TaxID=159736 RepID=UPI0030C8C4A2